MGWTASSALFSGLVFVAIAGAAVGACTLVVLIIRDWRHKRLW